MKSFSWSELSSNQGNMSWQKARSRGKRPGHHGDGLCDVCGSDETLRLVLLRELDTGTSK